MPQNKVTDTAQSNMDDLPELSAPEQEYVRLVVQQGYSQSAAYRQAFKKHHLADSTVWAEASRLQGSHKVQEWLQALRGAELQRAVIEYEDWLSRMQALAARAEQAGNYGAAVNALDKLAKAGGLYVERYEDVTPRDESTLHELVQAISQLLGPDAAQQAARQLGLHNEHTH